MPTQPIQAGSNPINPYQVLNEYEGWCNRFTWLVSLWLSNDAGSYQDVLDMALAVDNDPQSSDADKIYELAEQLKSYVEDVNPTDCSLAGDMLATAFAWVDWREIAEHYLAMAQEHKQYMKR